MYSLLIAYGKRDTSFFVLGNFSMETYMFIQSNEARLRDLYAH